MKKIINYFRFANKKRAISPVIAVILLIGLAVAAAAAIFLIVLPLLQPTSNLEMTDAYILYDDDYTTAADVGEGYGKGTVVLANAGTGKIEITNISISYSIVVTGPWMPVPGAISLQSITPGNPFVIEPLTTSEELTIRFPLPLLNDDQTVFYRMVVETDGGAELDTTEETETVSEEDMQLSKDKPDISFTGTLGDIRRTTTISPTSVSDNSAIKNVTYEVSNTTWSMQPEIIEESLWRWNWATYDMIANGSYTLKMTVYDYAGLSDIVDNIPFTIDNDYIKPVISSVEGSSIKNGIGIAEVGESYAIEAEITDSGSAVSQVKEAFIHYKINDTGIITYSAALMTKGVGTTWTGNIPAQDIDSEALAKNITFYITAEDDDSNDESTSDIYAGVNDSTEPDFTVHTPVAFAGEGLPITISVTVEDKDKVETVNLVWRHGNDTSSFNSPDPWNVLTNISGTGETWVFELPYYYVTVEGIDYYLNATDPSGNLVYGNMTAYDGLPDSPYHITINDITYPTIEVESNIPSQITALTSDLTVLVLVGDNDKSFSWIGGATGQVDLQYHKGNDPIDYYSSTPMTHVDGDSASSGTIFWGSGIWQATIKGGNFTTAGSPVNLRIRAEDGYGKNIYTEDIEPSIVVVAGGVPILSYMEESVAVSGTNNGTLKFRINNTASGSATASINAIGVELLNHTKPDWTGVPYIDEIQEFGSGIVWNNDTSNDEGSNNTKLDLDTPFDLTAGFSTELTLIYANSSGGYFDLNDLTVNVTIYYGATYQILDNFNTPNTNFVIISPPDLYMRNEYSTITGYKVLGTSQTITGTEDEVTQTGSSPFPLVTWGIRAFIRHSNGSETEVTPYDWVATVTLNTETGLLQDNSWTPTETPLESTDAIVIRVYVQIAGFSRTEIMAFKTEELGATKLLATEWDVFYWTRINYQWFNYRARTYYGYGSSAWDSRIEGLSYQALP